MLLKLNNGFKVIMNKKWLNEFGKQIVNVLFEAILNIKNYSSDGYYLTCTLHHFKVIRLYYLFKAVNESVFVGNYSFF